MILEIPKQAVVNRIIPKIDLTLMMLRRLGVFVG